MIELHGKAVEKYVVGALDRAGKKLNEDGVYNLEGGDFSITLSGASAGYPIAVQFAFEDITALKKEAEEMAANLGTTALRYRKSEQASTVR
ncbi:MAG: hypothetical protein IRY90_02750 [Actinomadura rubrobrunea]|nr:hypothetical protein [Actinomadura rubrobrunea]